MIDSDNYTDYPYRSKFYLDIINVLNGDLNIVHKMYVRIYIEFYAVLSISLHSILDPMSLDHFHSFCCVR